MFQNYIDKKRAENTRHGLLKANVDAIERWNTRILPRGLDLKGVAGANQYLADYGRGISAKKCIGLACICELNGRFELAMGFWAKAYELETGSVPEVAGVEADCVVFDEAPKMNPVDYPGVLPTHLRLGRISTMQPTDAKYPREYYITNDAYWGQPKRDGNRLVVIADKHGIFYQSRSTKERGAPSIQTDGALRKALATFGPFVLDGELVYNDYAGGEHRTGAQAATINIETGNGEVQPLPTYSIFRALYYEGHDLTNLADHTRVEAGAIIGDWLASHIDCERFEFLHPARTSGEKWDLAKVQEIQGREGEVWFRWDARYLGGKDNHIETTVRTKYITELEVEISRLTKTTAVGRPFGAIEIRSLDGKDLGGIGTGFTIEEMGDIYRRHMSGTTKIRIAHQGYTEDGKIWHGRFIEIVE